MKLFIVHQILLLSPIIAQKRLRNVRVNLLQRILSILTKSLICHGGFVPFFSRHWLVPFFPCHWLVPLFSCHGLVPFSSHARPYSPDAFFVLLVSLAGQVFLPLHPQLQISGYVRDDISDDPSNTVDEELKRCKINYLTNKYQIVRAVRDMEWITYLTTNKKHQIV